MSNTLFEVKDLPSGETLIADLYAHGSDTVIESISLEEEANRLSTFAGVITSASAGDYVLYIRLDGETVYYWTRRNPDLEDSEDKQFFGDIETVLKTGSVGPWTTGARSVGAFPTTPTLELSEYLTLVRGDTLSWEVNLGMDVSAAEIKASLKEIDDLDEGEDEDALFLVDNDTGLLVINQSSTGVTAGNGSINVTDESTGILTLTVTAEEIAKLHPRTKGCVLEFQIKKGGVVSTPWRKGVTILADAVRAT